MRPLKVALSALLFTLSPAAASAQTGAPQNRPPTVGLTAPASRVVMLDAGVASPACTPTASTLQLHAKATDPDGDRLLYAYSTTGGRAAGDGPNATLDLTGVAPGTYTVTVEVRDGRGGTASDTTTVEVNYCACSLPVPVPCPTVTVSCPDVPGPGRQITYTASVSGGDPNVTPTFNWTVSAGTISRGQGTGSITVDASKTFDSSFTGTVNVGGYERSCETSAGCSLAVEPPVGVRKLDEYGDIQVGDEKARLGNFAVELQNDPTASAHLICYGGRRGGARAARRRCRRAADYLGSGFLGIDDPRIVIVEGGRRESLAVELWLVPSGATPPRPAPAATGRGRR